MGIGTAVRERAAKATCLLIDGKPVNPWLMGIDFSAQSSSPQSLELRLGLPILIFELQQCGVNVSRDNILAFVLDDIKNHRNEALDGYLIIVGHVVNPPPPLKSLSWFARVFTSPPKWTPPPPQWKWASVDEVTLSDDEALVIRGNCCPVAAP
jgi:hypothetical protein